MKISNQSVAVLAIILAVGTIFAAFWLSRADHDLKLMSLQAVLTTGGTLLGIAGTLLVGVQAYKSIVGGTDPAELPPGSQVTQAQQTSVSVPPVTTTTPSPEPPKETP